MSFITYFVGLAALIVAAVSGLSVLGVPIFHIVNAAVILLAFGMLIGASRTDGQNIPR